MAFVRFLILCGMVRGTLCLNLKSFTHMSTENTISSLRQKIYSMEWRLLSLENKEKENLSEKVRDELSAMVHDAVQEFLEDRSEPAFKIKDIHTTRYGRNKRSVTMEELNQRTMEHKKDFDKKLADLKMTMEEMSRSFDMDKNIFLIMNNQLLQELQIVKKTNFDALEKIRSVEEEAKRSLERDRLNIESLEVKENLTRILINSHIESERDVEEVIRKNISSSTETLRLHISESLLGFENMQADFTKNIRSIQNSLSEIERDRGNASFVTKLDEDLKNLDKVMKAEVQSIQAEIYPRVKKLEERCQMCEDVAVLDKRLKNHTSEIDALNRQLLDFQNTCDEEPPPLLNGKPKNFNRQIGSRVQYECDQNFLLFGNSTVHCKSGKWEGHPPDCSFFDTTFYLEASGDFGAYIRCYSDYNSKKIEFSRLTDAATAGEMPSDATRRSYDKSEEIYFSSYDHIYGLYKCGFKNEGLTVELLLPLQSYSSLNFVDPFRVANIGDSVEFKIYSAPSISSRWKHNGVNVSSWDGKTEVVIPDVKTSDAGIYELYYETSVFTSDTIGFLKLTVRKCKANLYGQHCDQKCPDCYNGGVCHDILGICLCPDGFIGNNCEKACPEGYQGADCSVACRSQNCKYGVHCKPDPYGCACARGYNGTLCGTSCLSGAYGADCRQSCHCKNGPTYCNRITGVCSGGCTEGWTGESCQIKVLD